MDKKYSDEEYYETNMFLTKKDFKINQLTNNNYWLQDAVKNMKATIKINQAKIKKNKEKIKNLKK